MRSTGGFPGTDLDERLRAGGVFAAFERMCVDVDEIRGALSAGHHHYERYRWSVALGDGFREVVHALPPEEEVGWTPWERWTTDEDGNAVHQCWVTAVVHGAQRVAWRTLDEPQASALTPLFGAPEHDLRERWEVNGVRDALAFLGMDPGELLAQVGPQALAQYTACRWVVIPHFLAGGGPVVYSIPPAGSADRWPWETWYAETSGGTTHHAHFGRSSPGFVQEWFEPAGAPQRPPEVLGQTWFWADPGSLDPVMG